MVGNIGVGGDNPIRMQSMTTSSTRDVEATVEQIIRLADAGCEIARVTVQGMKEADACEGIKNGLIQKGYTIPLVADIHFYPPAAMRVVDFVDKVRVNPGNLVDRRATFRTREYDDATYASEIEKIEEKFAPLVEKCKKLKRAMRIGTNHGSLSDRIMNRYGDTPFGMVESALEFARVCRNYNYHDFMFSMKASNPIVMIQAYRLLAAEMMDLGWDYPLHLGVTEAGEGEDGRIKSSVGIGALLLDGLGDTIRVSLTEDPWKEIDPCERLIAFFDQYQKQTCPAFTETTRNIREISPRPVENPIHRDGAVILSVSEFDTLKPNFAEEIEGVDALISKSPLRVGEIPVIETPYIVDCTEPFEKILQDRPTAIFLNPQGSRLHQARLFFEWLKTHQVDIPVYLHFSYTCSREDFLIQAAAECGALLADKLGEGLALQGDYPLEFLKRFQFNLLQACRMRTVKTDFISCPGCGRTLFDLQEVSRKIREKTDHLPGVKIAIMGCIVNGPGEMADADFGYVGSKPGKIDLYVGKTCVERNIDDDEAVERLIELIKTHDRWVEPNTIKSSV